MNKTYVTPLLSYDTFDTEDIVRTSPVLTKTGDFSENWTED